MGNSTRPLIGITCGSLSLADWSGNSPSLPVDYVFRNYQRAIEQAGGLPVLIPILERIEVSAELLNRLDGLGSFRRRRPGPPFLQSGAPAGSGNRGPGKGSDRIGTGCPGGQDGPSRPGDLPGATGDEHEPGRHSLPGYRHPRPRAA